MAPGRGGGPPGLLPPRPEGAEPVRCEPGPGLRADAGPPRQGRQQEQVAWGRHPAPPRGVRADTGRDARADAAGLRRQSAVERSPSALRTDPCPAGPRARGGDHR